MTIARGSLRSEGGGRAGFTIIELAIVVVVAGLLLVPLLRIAGSSIISTRLKETQSRLDTARDALVAFAAVNGGCLPFASDFEGGLPDTDASGAQSTPDTGDRSSNQNAGDLPWADLGLTNAFIDGDNLRIQYYVATPYTDGNGVDPITCDAGFRGFQWDSGVTYDAPFATPIYVFDNDPGSGDRTLYEIKKNKSLAAGTHPSDGGNDVTAHPEQLPRLLLEVRRGPDVTNATGGQNDVISAQDVFVLIAPGPNRNADIDRLFSRDSVHTNNTGGVWTLGTTTVDGVLFSTEPNIDATDSANSGDDTLLVMSFIEFKAEMSKHGLNMEPVCESPC